MPTYEYKCDACGQAFEKFQSIKADPIKTCPHCGKDAVRRLISMGGGLIFKGSGFYITDYRDKGYTDSAKADSAAGGGDKAEKAEKAGDKGDKGDKGSDKGEKSDKPATGDAAAKPADSKPAATTPTPSPSPTPAKSES